MVPLKPFSRLIPFFLLLVYALQSIASDTHPFYLGVASGYGSTTWDGIVPPEKNKNLAMSLSTPLMVHEGGAVWGAFLGVELNRYFALETNYFRFPNARVIFDKGSLFSFMNHGMTEFITHTETVNLMGKVMLIIPHTSIRVFSSVGAAGVHRNDLLYDNWRLSPTFGFGFNHDFTPHWMGEIGATYTAGYGESQLNPADVYVPFLYSVLLRVAYRI